MKRRSPAQWRTLFQEQQNSGLNATAFSRAQGICPKYFSLRRRQLSDGAASAAEAVSAFVPVALPRAAEAPALEGWLGTTLQLRVPTSVSPRWLADLLHALRR